MKTTGTPAFAVPRMQEVSSSYLLGPLWDAGLLVAVPAAAAAVLSRAPTGLDPLFRAIFIYGVTTGHFVAGFFYAYGQPEIFSRYRLRLTLIPPVVLVLAVVLGTLGSQAMLLLLAAWRLIHGGKQHYGIARIYSLKAGDFSEVSKRVDGIVAFLSTLAFVPFFVTTFVLVSPSGKFLAFSSFVGPLKEVEVWLRVVSFVAAAIGIALSLRRSIAGETGGTVKWLFVLGTLVVGCWITRSGSRPFVSFCLLECLHGLQYFAVTWRPTLALSGELIPNPAWRNRLNAVGVNVIVLFAGLGLLNSLTLTDRGGLPQRAAFALLLSCRLLHYYNDGFIWKLRELPHGDLGIPRAGMSPQRMGWSDLVRQLSLIAAASGFAPVWNGWWPVKKA